MKHDKDCALHVRMFVQAHLSVYSIHYYVGKSFVEMVEYLFKNIPDLKFFLSNRICQDPLENFFGHQRQRGKVNDNPNSAEFIKNTQALRVINSTCATIRGNCRDSKGKESVSRVALMAENCTPLPKRSKK